MAANDDYFAAYGNLEVHKLMLKDTARTDAYRDAIERLAERGLIQGRTVLDVGCGTGVLSLFCARAGAARVIAVEGCQAIAEGAEHVARSNGFGPDVVTVIAGRMEDVHLPVDEVDIIVSEWMGFYLVHESMLASVLLARDRYLKEDGLMLPSRARLFCCPVDMSDYCDERFGFWTDVYGFDMSTFIQAEATALLSAPVITAVDATSCLTAPTLVADLDCRTMPADEARARITRALPFVAQKDGICHGFCFAFTVDFDPCDADEGAASSGMVGAEAKGEGLSTLPGAPLTHWKQTVVMLPEMLAASPGARLDCTVDLRPSRENERHYEISLSMGTAEILE